LLTTNWLYAEVVLVGVAGLPFHSYNHIWSSYHSAVSQSLHQFPPPSFGKDATKSFVAPVAPDDLRHRAATVEQLASATMPFISLQAENVCELKLLTEPVLLTSPEITVP
jgi:hypothetical protein